MAGWGGTKGILGKTIVGIIKKRNAIGTTPKDQVFLLFSDNTYFEFYSIDGRILCTGGVDEGGLDAVRGYMKGAMDIEFEILS